MPTIRIDDDVYRWLKSLATPFEDNPNSVLRRVAGIERGPARTSGKIEEEAESNANESRGTDMKRPRGKVLSEEWGVVANHSLYSEYGNFYENLRDFPGALWDQHGYVLFRTERDYVESPYLQKGKKLNVPRGISSIPGYNRVPR